VFSWDRRVSASIGFDQEAGERLIIVNDRADDVHTQLCGVELRDGLSERAKVARVPECGQDYCVDTVGGKEVIEYCFDQMSAEGV